MADAVAGGRASRANRGNRCVRCTRAPVLFPCSQRNLPAVRPSCSMGKLIAEAEGDDEFWNQDAWKEARDSLPLATAVSKAV